MRFNKIIYIRYIPLTAKVYKDFYMDEVEKAGIDMEYWDVSALFFKNSYDQEDSSFLTNTIKFDTYDELEKAIIKLQPLANKLFVSIMTFEGRVLKLYKMFTKYNCVLAVFGRNMLPLPAQNRKSIYYSVKNISFEKVKRFLNTRSIIRGKENGRIKPYDIMFLGGTEGWKGIGIINENDVAKAEIIKVNSDDYDNYLMLKGAKRIIDYDYILFLDEYLPLHPDTLLFGIKNVSEKQYYPELNKYFDRVEEQFGMPVVIAAHPKAVRYKNEDFFNGRKVFFEQTSQLTEHSNFVLAHDTTSINYAISFNKRLHFITSKNIYNEINMVHRNSANFADFLGCNLQWFDKNDPINLIEELPVENYEKYRNKFQTSCETQNKLSKDVFIEFLKQYLAR